MLPRILFDYCFDQNPSPFNHFSSILTINDQRFVSSIRKIYSLSITPSLFEYHSCQLSLKASRVGIKEEQRTCSTQERNTETRVQNKKLGNGKAVERDSFEAETRRGGVTSKNRSQEVIHVGGEKQKSFTKSYEDKVAEY